MSRTNRTYCKNHRNLAGNTPFASAYNITKAFGGDWCGNYGLVPGPGHSPHDRSLSVRDGKNGEIIVHSFAGDDWRECRDYIKSHGHYISGSSEQTPLPKPDINQDDNLDYILKIWSQSVNAAGTIVETYLQGRKADLPDDAPIRCHPQCPRRKQRLPAMVSLITDIQTNKPCGLHRTYLKPDGSGKVEDQPDKAILGRAKGGVVRLSPNEDVTCGLGICEGVETGLSIIGFGWRPIWAAISSGGIANFPILNGIQALTIFADHDNNGAGQKAARQCAERWANSGREVTIRTPIKFASDWNDVAQEAWNE